MCERLPGRSRRGKSRKGQKKVGAEFEIMGVELVHGRPEEDLRSSKKNEKVCVNERRAREKQQRATRPPPTLGRMG